MISSFRISLAALAVAMPLSACTATLNEVQSSNAVSASARNKTETSVETQPTDSAAESLRSYYAGLNQSLPIAGPMAQLDEGKALTRITFGSCIQENRPQDFWTTIGARKSDLFLLIGDNVYGDTGATWAADLPSLRDSYAKLASAPEFQAFRKQTPMMTSWDDHDYGANDAGASFAFKEYAETIYETFWNVPNAVKSRPGVYESRMVGPAGQRVQIITLDTRFFRSDMTRLPYSAERRPLGNYGENAAPDATILGAEQWAWLEQELEKPADLRLIFSSIQVITKAHDYESWSNFPLEHQRLYKLLADKSIDNAVLFSGDRHSGGLYKTELAGMSKPLWELTASSLNFSFGSGDTGDREPDADRVGGFFSDENFGQIDIDWAKRNVTLTLVKSDGSTLLSQDVPALK